ncbi:NUDIX hydrolase [Cutibacterium granulosum]|uniref:NUDIX hydrolase n=1 Tax=Cutibacterium granulosum TaxID=33011 RepID=UPI002B237A51|nr:NUDIX domain-containing protein [Cutibacterium granulosum]MEA5639881.1 NUDIX domain-containing protein [Cutibacterium granulosum]
MPTPQFILDLRQQIGHRPLWLIGTTGVIWREAQDESYEGSCPAHIGGNALDRVSSDDGGSSSGVSGCVMSDEPDREVLNDSDRAAQPGVVWAEQEERGSTSLQILLVRRADSGAWTPVCGIVEPGERPDHTIVREALGEAQVHVVVDRYLAVDVDDPLTYPNGDQYQFLNHVFSCRWVDGQARVGDDESSQVRWFDIDELPALSVRHRAAVELALAPPRGAVLGLLH